MNVVIIILFEGYGLKESSKCQLLGTYSEEELRDYPRGDIQV